MRWLRTWSVPAALLAAGVLAGCQQPTPGVSVQSGSRVVHASATLYIRDGKQTASSHGVKVLKVHPGALVNIDVDHAIATKGWALTVTSGTSKNDTVTSPVLHLQHFSFDAGSATSDVVIAQQGTGSTPSGLWAFTLQPVLQ